MKVGDVIYFKAGDFGQLYSEKEIVGETSRSWLVLDVNTSDWQRRDIGMYARKIPKNLKGYLITTKDGADKQRWAINHRYRISQEVYACRDAKVLLTIARILGYNEVPEEAK